MNNNIIFPEQSISFIGISGMIMFSVIFIIGFLLLMRYSAKIMPGVISVLVYLMVVVVGVEVITFIFSVIPGLNYLIMESALAFCIFRGIAMAGLIALTVWITIRFSGNNNNFYLGDAMMAGYGAALGQAIVTGIDLIYLWTMGSTINEYGTESLLADLSEADAAQMLESINQVVEVPPVFYLFKGINSAIDIVYIVIISLIVYAIMKKGLSKTWYVFAVACSAVLTIANLLGDYGVVAETGILTGVKAVVIITAILMVFKINAENLDGELTSFDRAKRTVKFKKK